MNRIDQLTSLVMRHLERRSTHRQSENTPNTAALWLANVASVTGDPTPLRHCQRIRYALQPEPPRYEPSDDNLTPEQRHAAETEES